MIGLEYFKNIDIIIADDSFKKYKQQNKLIIEKYKKINNNIKYLDLPHDTGLSYGRNAIVKKCNTKYIMIIDDSRTFNLNTNINKMIKFLENTNYDLIGGHIKQRHGMHSHYTGIINQVIIKNKIPIVYLRKINSSDKIKYNKLKVFHDYCN